MVQKVAEVAAVAATSRAFILFAFCAVAAQAAVLPQERADAMFHSYDGGGITVDGPSVLVRKNFKETLSISGNYYVDNISSASIDVLASGASRYSEERTEYSVGANYLYDKSILSAGYTNSDESDYQAETFYFGISQDFFGDLTNITFGYALGEDEGFLNNPYRSYRFLTDPLDPSAGFQLAQEVYPDTRTSDAINIRYMYHLPWQASTGGSYRYFTDDWGIDAHTVQFSYTHVLYENWTADIKYRYYQQTAADFYSDLFQVPSQDEKDFRARDKAALSFQWDRIFFSYDNFTDLTNPNTAVGEEELYDFEADVFKVLSLFGTK